MRFAVFALMVGASLLNAQTFTFGVKGGGWITRPAERQDDSRKYVVGGSAEVGFANRFGVEVDALYSRFGSSTFNNVIRGNSWEFPVLGKYYLADRSSPVRPFAGGGVAFRNIWLEDRFRPERFGRDNSGLNTTDPAVGAVFGGGVTVRMWRLGISPEVRYTRWGGFNYPATNPNQVQALVGITF